jgi:hypothetical protein
MTLRELRGDDQVTPAAFNAMLRKVKSIDLGSGGHSANGRRLRASDPAWFNRAELVRVKNAEASTVLYPWYPAGICDVIADDGMVWHGATTIDIPTSQDTAVEVKAPAAQHFGDWVVPIQRLAAGQFGWAVRSGVCPVKFARHFADKQRLLRRADIWVGTQGAIGSDAEPLVENVIGKARVLWVETGLSVDTEGWAIVLIEASPDGVLRAENQSASSLLSMGGAATLDDDTSGNALGVNGGIALWNPYKSAIVVGGSMSMGDLGAVSIGAGVGRITDGDVGNIVGPNYSVSSFGPLGSTHIILHVLGTWDGATWAVLQPHSMVPRTVKAASDGASVTLSGTQTVDGISCGGGDLVLCKDQGSASGVYAAQSGSWVKLPDDGAVYVVSGDVNAQLIWIRESGGTTWVPAGAVWQ